MKFYIHTLGCKVNSYESKVMKDILINNNYKQAETDKNNDIIIINTCSVTNEADNKSVKVIKKSIRDNENAIIIVTGCFSQKDEEFVSSIPGVSIVLGNKNKTKIIDYINEYIENNIKKSVVEDISQIEFESMMLNNFDKTRAFVKIQDGCNNFCTFCIIPYTRGGCRSKKKEDAINEVKTLIKNGHKEIVLTGIHTGNYGAEFDNYDFADLLNDILKIDGLKRLRISSIEVNEINDRVLNLIKNNKILVDHMHIPLQSGSDKILKLMNRKYNKNEFLDKIKNLRNIRKDISITTDIITGFPNETEEDFKEMVEFIKKINFTKLHVFPYSRREGTKADLFKNQIDDKIKKDRVKILLNLSKELENNYMNKYINKEVIFIPEVYKDGFIKGHTGNYLSIKSKGTNKDINKEIKVNILNNEYPYLIGK